MKTAPNGPVDQYLFIHRPAIVLFKFSFQCFIVLVTIKFRFHLMIDYAKVIFFWGNQNHKKVLFDLLFLSISTAAIPQVYVKKRLALLLRQFFRFRVPIGFYCMSLTFDLGVKIFVHDIPGHQGLLTHTFSPF